MNLEEAEMCVLDIKKASHDPERAHSKEDDLHIAVLKAIVEGHKDVAQLARIALETLDIEFSRWYA